MSDIQQPERSGDGRSQRISNDQMGGGFQVDTGVVKDCVMYGEISILGNWV